jgi:deoxyribose-phosphate aldolase
MTDLISRIISEMVLPGPKPQHTCSSLSGSGCSVCGHCAVNRSAEVESMASAGATRISLVPGGGASLKAKIARMIDHTLLKPEASELEIRRLCEEAVKHGFASVCVNPCWVQLCAKLVKGSRVKVCTVVGFPLGGNSSATKAFEAAQAVKDGADELDMVANIGQIKSGKLDLVEQDIREVVKAAKGRPVKVILESCLLTDAEKVRAALAAKAAGAAFVKTSTGFSTGGATVNDVALLRRVVGSQMGIKAAGGVRDLDTALKLIESGATRIGASASVGIVA